MIIFITATDTDAGKSFITAALALHMLKRGLKTGVQKWISTGDGDVSIDIEYIKRLLNASCNSEELKRLTTSSPYCFSYPSSPHLASRLDNENIDKDMLISATKELNKECDVVLLEGIGGLMVPVDENTLLIDLIAMLACKVILVSRAGLGTINHTLLSVEALKIRKIDLNSIVLNDIGPLGQKIWTDDIITEDNKAIIRHLAGVPVIGPVPFANGPEEAIVQEMIKEVADNVLGNCENEHG